MPIFAARVLHGGPHTLGFLMGAMGVGALISALSLAARKSVLGLTRMIQISAAMFGAGLILFGLSHVLWLSLLAIIVKVGSAVVFHASGDQQAVVNAVAAALAGLGMALSTHDGIAAAVLGLTARRHRAAGVIGMIAVFGAGAAFAVLTRPGSHAADVIPALVGGVAGAVTLATLACIESMRTALPVRVDVRGCPPTS